MQPIHRFQPSGVRSHIAPSHQPESHLQSEFGGSHDDESIDGESDGFSSNESAVCALCSKEFSSQTISSSAAGSSMTLQNSYSVLCTSPRWTLRNTNLQHQCHIASCFLVLVVI